LILIGTGSEVFLCAQAADQLRNEGHKVRVVSMPCWEVFEDQDPSYQESVLPKAVTKRLAVEAGTSFGWGRYAGSEENTISVNHFGFSAPGGLVMEKMGFTSENVVTRAKALLSA
jgi:transketolase